MRSLSEIGASFGLKKDVRKPNTSEYDFALARDGIWQSSRGELVTFGRQQCEDGVCATVTANIIAPNGDHILMDAHLRVDGSAEKRVAFLLPVSLDRQFAELSYGPQSADLVRRFEAGEFEPVAPVKP